jgi:hypothetical protein
MIKQFTVEEKNHWERETFNYVFKATEEQAAEIKLKCKKIGKGDLSIKETSFSINQIKKMNNASGNSYMDFIATYELQKNAIDNWTDRGDCFYKGNGLNRIE